MKRLVLAAAVVAFAACAKSEEAPMADSPAAAVAPAADSMTHAMPDSAAPVDSAKKDSTNKM